MWCLILTDKAHKFNKLIKFNKFIIKLIDS